MQIGVSKEEFEVHLQSVKHMRNRSVRALSSLSSSAETVFNAPSVSLANNNRDCLKCDENHNSLSNIANGGVDHFQSRHDETMNDPMTDSVTSTDMAAEDFLNDTDGADNIHEESGAYIETNIPFADPVIVGNSHRVQFSIACPYNAYSLVVRQEPDFISIRYHSQKLIGSRAGSSVSPFKRRYLRQFQYQFLFLLFSVLKKIQTYVGQSLLSAAT